MPAGFDRPLMQAGQLLTQRSPGVQTHDPRQASSLKLLKAAPFLLMAVSLGLTDMRPRVEPKWPRGFKGWIAKLFLAALIFLSWWVAFDIALSNFPASHPHPVLRLLIGIAIVLYVLQL